MEIGSTLSGYRILSRVGVGGMGEVYRARDSSLQREVALKVLPASMVSDPTALHRFEREAKLLASVNHPHIATIHGIEEADGIRFLVLELLSGESLDRRLARGPLPVAKALRLAGQVADALQAAHKRGIVHRDLKPANIMITEDGWTKVLDFGLAKDAAAEERLADASLEKTQATPGFETPDLTAAGVLLGTVPYMSPEQVKDRLVDWRSDIWAFGCVTYETLTGQRAFARATTVETFSAILESTPDWSLFPAEVPDGVRKLIGRCLRKDPDQRLHAMTDARIELEESLHALLAGQAVPGGSAPAPAAESLSAISPPSAVLSYLDTIGSYTVVERLDVGGIGEVYRAHDPRMDRDVAIKVLRSDVSDDASRRRLRAEADILSRLDHPRIPALYGFDSQENLDYLATEYVPGESLARRLSRGPLPENELAAIGAQIAEGLEAAHRAGIVHRDLKPGNVQLSTAGDAMLIDFGQAKTREDAVSELSGPLPYAAPELVRQDPCDHRVDIYALGVVLYQMATGERPYRETSVEQLAESILKDQVRAPSALNPRVSADLDEVILRCLEKRPEERYATAEAVARDLSRLASGTAAGGLRRGARRLPRLALAVGVLATAAIVAAVFWKQRPPPPQPGPRVESLVVMPGGFAGPEGDEFLADALANSLSAHLARVQGLETRVPPTRQQVVDAQEDRGRIAQAFGTEALVVTAVEAEADGLTLGLEIVDAASLDPIWSGDFQGGREALGDLTRRAAEGVLEALGYERAAVTASGAAGGSSVAEVELQRAIFYSKLFTNRGRPGDFERARSAFEETLLLDPGSARAMAGMAVLHLSRINAGASPLEVGPEAESWARRALDVDPRSGLAWAALSTLQGGRTSESYREKLEFALKAVKFDPREAFTHRALSVALGINSFELGLQAARQATRQDPLVINSPLIEATFLLQGGRNEEGIQRVDQVLAVEPDWPFALLFQSLALSVAGREEEAAEMIPRLESLAERQLVLPAWVAASKEISSFGVASRSGRGGSPEATAALEALMKMGRGETPFPRWQTITAGLPILLARHGHPDRATEILRFRVEHEVKDPYDLLLFNPDLDSVRGRTELREVLDGAAGRFEEMVAILEESKERDELPGYLERPLSDLLGRIRAARLRL